MRYYRIQKILLLEPYYFLNHRKVQYMLQAIHVDKIDAYGETRLYTVILFRKGWNWDHILVTFRLPDGYHKIIWFLIASISDVLSTNLILKNHVLLKSFFLGNNCISTWIIWNCWFLRKISYNTSEQNFWPLNQPNGIIFYRKRLASNSLLTFNKRDEPISTLRSETDTPLYQ